MKRLFIIGASILQLPAIIKAKEMGLYVAVADYNPESIGIKYADEYFNVSTIDEEKIYEAAKEFRADGIMTLATDMPMRALAYAATKLNLVGINYETALKSTDKFLMIEAFDKNNVEHPWYIKIDKNYNLNFLKEHVKYPCIVKPTDNSGSRGVIKCNSFNELISSINYSSEKGRSGNVLIEEYLEGNEVSVEIIVYNKIPHVIQITDKLTTGAPHFVELGHTQPSSLNPSILNKVADLACRAVKSVGIENGPAHVEIMVTKNGPKMIELGARLGGDSITTYLVPLSTGVDMVKSTIEISLGIEPDLKIKYNKGSAIRFIQPEKGMIVNIDGLEKLKETSYIRDIQLTKNIGDHVNFVESSVDRIGHIIVQGNNSTEASKFCEEALKKIKVKYKKTILFLGGFPQMIDVIKTAKKMGINTIVTDMDPNSLAKKHADKAYDVSTNDIDSLERICKEEHVDGVFNGFEDFNIHIALKLCKRLQLPFYANENQLKIITNKDEFISECKKNDIEIIEEYTLDEAITCCEYPYIIKPVDSYGSRGISICRDENELKDGFNIAKDTSKTNKVIIEKFIDSNVGTELFYTVVNGNVHLTTTADRYTVKTGETNVPLPIAEVFPSKFRNEIVHLLDCKIKKMIKGMGIQNGLVLIQTINDGDKFLPYEMAFRLTGEQHYELVREQQGLDLSEMMIKLCLGEDISKFDTKLIDDDHFIKPSINLSIVLKEGIIKEISGLESLYDIPEIKDLIITHDVGDVITSKGDYSRIFIRMNIVSNNNAELSSLINSIQSKLAVLSNNGSEMIAGRFNI